MMMMVFVSKTQRKTPKGKNEKKKEEKATVQKAGLENPLVQEFGSRCRVVECASQYKKA